MAAETPPPGGSGSAVEVAEKMAEEGTGMHFHRSALTMACLLALGGCAPTTAAYLSVPVQLYYGRHRERVTVRVPLQELESRMPEFDRAVVAFYGRGRLPIPHYFVDADEDGTPEAAVLTIPVEPDGTTRLTVVCPGPTATGPAPRRRTSRGVVLRFDRADH